MSPSAKRLHDQHLQQAEVAEAAGNKRAADKHRKAALTFTFPIGDVIAQTYN